MYDFEWNPGDDICIGFDDKSASDRTKEQLSEMILKMKEVANEYDFDLKHWGNESSAEKYYIGLNKYKAELYERLNLDNVTSE